jgi:hypothetical protein
LGDGEVERDFGEEFEIVLGEESVEAGVGEDFCDFVAAWTGVAAHVFDNAEDWKRYFLAEIDFFSDSTERYFLWCSNNYSTIRFNIF